MRRSRKLLQRIHRMHNPISIHEAVNSSTQVVSYTTLQNDYPVGKATKRPNKMSKVSLSLEEIEQLGELLARIPEAFTPMEPDKLDGFLTALTLMKNPPAQPDWMNYVFDIDGNPRARLSQHEQAQLQKLILRRGREIEETVLSEKPIDPICTIPMS